MRRWYWLSALAACGLLIGCAAEPRETGDVRLVRGRPFEPDIPVPAHFVMVEESSEDRSTGTRRLYLRHEYEGDGDKYAVRGFYREQMPLARWSKAGDGNIKGEFNMRFEKGDESCTVLISDHPSLWSRRTRVRIIVASEERGAAPPSTRTGP